MAALRRLSAEARAKAWLAESGAKWQLWQGAYLGLCNACGRALAADELGSSAPTLRRPHVLEELATEAANASETRPRPSNAARLSSKRSCLARPKRGSRGVGIGLFVPFRLNELQVWRGRAGVRTQSTDTQLAEAEGEEGTCTHYSALPSESKQPSAPATQPLEEELRSAQAVQRMLMHSIHGNAPMPDRKPMVSCVKRDHNSLNLSDILNANRTTVDKAACELGINSAGMSKRALGREVHAALESVGMAKPKQNTNGVKASPKPPPDSEQEELRRAQTVQRMVMHSLYGNALMPKRKPMARRDKQDYSSLTLSDILQANRTTVDKAACELGISPAGMGKFALGREVHAKLENVGMAKSKKLRSNNRTRGPSKPLDSDVFKVEEECAGSSFREVIMMDEMAKAMKEAHALEVTTVNVRHECTWTDAFVLASAKSEEHVRILSSAALNKAREKAGMVSRKHSVALVGDSSVWQTVDAGNCVVHVVLEEARKRLGFEDLWADADRSNVIHY